MRIRKFNHLNNSLQEKLLWALMWPAYQWICLVCRIPGWDVSLMTGRAAQELHQQKYPELYSNGDEHDGN